MIERLPRLLERFASPKMQSETHSKFFSSRVPRRGEDDGEKKTKWSLEEK